MVAYSFKAMFAHQVETGTKRQTVRAHRMRHARLGEPIQLFTAMRTKHCRKLLDPDPICEGWDIVTIEFDREGNIAEIRVAGTALADEAMEQFAIDDGFGVLVDPDGNHDTALKRMAAFWNATHGTQRFDGVVIRWRPDHG